MMNARTFAKIVGRKKIAHVLGVGVSAVGNAIQRGEFPASWRAGCEHLADLHGIECPPHMFAMREFKRIEGEIA